MNTLLLEIQVAKAQNVIVTDETLTVDLTDGRTLSVPPGWYPRLLNGTAEERYITIGPSNGGHLLMVAHTERGDAIRIISARELTVAEREAYEEGF